MKTGWEYFALIALIIVSIALGIALARNSGLGVVFYLQHPLSQITGGRVVQDQGGNAERGVRGDVARGRRVRCRRGELWWPK